MLKFMVIIISLLISMCLAENSSNTKRVKRATQLANVASITTYPFVVSIITPIPTQGLGVIVHENWVLSRDRLVYNYTDPTARTIKLKSDDVNVVTGGKLHRAIKLVYHPSRTVNVINIMALVKVCPPFASSSKVVLPAATAVWSAGTSVTVLRWVNDLTQLKEQTATLQNQATTCAAMGNYQPTLQVCTENMGFGVYDMGVPIVSIPGKVLIGIGTRRSLGSATQAEGFEDVSKYLGWINPILLT